MNSKIILCKGIKLDRDYVNVIDYTESQMLELCNSQGIKVAEANDYSFIPKEQNSIMVNFTYNQCLISNYIAFQNPDYSNKWFFAWIDDVIFKGETTTKITFTIDAWSTWFDKWTKKSCFVKRQHVNDDTVGINTQPEPVELGKAMVVENEVTKLYTNFYLCALISPKKDDTVNGLLRNGIYSGLGAVFVDSLNAGSMNNALNNYMDDFSRVQRVIQYPSVLSSSNTYEDDLIISKLNTIDGYTPVNKKLLTFPYKQLRVSASNGENTVLQYELFSENSATFGITGALLPECFISIYPESYRGLNKDMSKKINLKADIECAWGSGTYTNGLVNKQTSDALNLVSNTILTGIAIGGLATGATEATMATQMALGSGIASGIASTGNRVNDYVKARNESGQVHGGSSSNVSDVVSYNLGFRVYQECIKREYAERIDNFLTRYGYAINDIVSPNLTGRSNWNYIEIANTEEIGDGDVPSKFMEIINNICRKGVSIWHNHSNVGNFSLNNAIV